MSSDAPGEILSQPPSPELGGAVADPAAPAGDDAVTAEARPARVDAVAGAAVELARAGAVEVGGDQVGDYLGRSAIAERVVEHTFAATVPGYRGWYWSVVVARASRSRLATVDEVVLLPGGEALRAPAWLPWVERIRPGDLGAGDLLPSAPDDDRLVPAYVDDADDDMIELAFEVGLGRPRVLSLLGRLDAADRWLSEGNGPETPMARQAPGHCGTCGFLVPLTGSLRAAFGVCANAMAAADAQVVAVDYGCGAHSEAALDSSGPAEGPGVVYDDAEIIIESQPSELP
ncbi:MAG: DUF3027 domain-containing protein [bacterium]